MTCGQMRGGVMDRLDLRLFNINYSVFTDVAEAYRQLRLAFEMKPHSPTGLPRSLTLKQHSSDTTRYSLWYEDVFQCDFSDQHAAVRQLEHSLLQRAVREDFGLTIFHAAWLEKRNIAVLLVGGSNSGKTRLGVELLNRGFRLGSDEATALQNRSGFLLPFYRNFLLKPPFSAAEASRIEAGSATGDDRYYLKPAGNPPAWAAPGPYRLKFVFLRPGGAAQKNASLRPLAVEESLGQLLQNCFNLRQIDQTAFRRIVRRLDPACAWELAYSELGEAADLISQLGSEP